MRSQKRKRGEEYTVFVYSFFWEVCCETEHLLNSEFVLISLFIVKLSLRDKRKKLVISYNFRITYKHLSLHLHSIKCFFFVHPHPFQMWALSWFASFCCFFQLKLVFSDSEYNTIKYGHGKALLYFTQLCLDFIFHWRQ